MNHKSKVVLGSWKFKAAGEEGWLPASVPGCVHTDLLKNGRISDPFYGTNERDLQWIDKQDWEYITEFSADAGLAVAEHAELVFDGLDTYAYVYLNGRLLIRADNMFRVWRADVKSLLRSSGNELRVYFRSPVNEDLPKLEKLGYALPAPNDDSAIGGLGDKKISMFARKAPYHYGWDWGPRFVTSGIWREARLECWSDTKIADVFIRQDKVNAEAAQLTAIVEFEVGGTIIPSTQNTDKTARVRVTCENGQWEVPARLEVGSQTVELPLELASPRLWWCRGLGEPHLYSFTAALVSEEGVVLSECSVKTGLRSVRLVTDSDLDGEGATFHIELNGVPVFAKGANHIPNDSFTTEVTYERYRHEIASAVQANMNMLRVWGGGIYENDEFYALCDEYGLLVWQDFMFACSLYPGDEAFLASVRQEAEDNLRRLRNHPSIVLWCGNNEIDIAWSNFDPEGGWGWKKDYTPEQREKLWNDYEAVFHRVLPEAVHEFAPGSVYWPSSPLAGLTGDKRQHAVSTSTMGDIHYWGVWHALEPFENYNVYVGRFMSEYGFQSFPEPRTVRSYAEESDMELESKVMLGHQKNNRGNRLIKDYMDMYMSEPKDFVSFLLMSQVLQAEGIKQAIEAHRRKKPYCMGSLYWQMNDCWPVASWASMDYFGRWKSLQYVAKRSFRDVALSIDGSGDRVDFHVITDILEPVNGKLRIRVFDFNGRLVSESTAPVSVEANSARIAFSIKPEQLLIGEDPAHAVLFAELEQDGRVIDAKEHYFVPMKGMELTSPTITVKEVQDSGGTQLVIETDRLARYVRLFSELEGIFTDNDFDLLPGLPKTIGFLERSDGESAFVPAPPGRVTVQSMADWIKR